MWKTWWMNLNAATTTLGFRQTGCECWIGFHLPARFPMRALQMSALDEAQMAPSSFITNAAYFQAADEQRRIQWVAYRAKSLSLEHDTELAASAYTGRRWEEDAVWQPLREAVEKMLIAYDRRLIAVVDDDEFRHSEKAVWSESWRILIEFHQVNRIALRMDLNKS